MFSYFVEMEYIEGKDMRMFEFVPVYERAKSARSDQWPTYPLSACQFLAWFAETFQQLACLHSKRIIHRDIRERNIMVEGDNLRLIDLDAACSLEPSSTQIPLCCNYDEYVIEGRSPEVQALYETEHEAPVIADNRIWQGDDVWMLGDIFLRLYFETLAPAEQLEEGDYWNLQIQLGNILAPTKMELTDEEEIAAVADAEAEEQRYLAERKRNQPKSERHWEFVERIYSLLLKTELPLDQRPSANALASEAISLLENYCNNQKSANRAARATQSAEF